MIKKVIAVILFLFLVPCLFIDRVDTPVEQAVPEIQSEKQIRVLVDGKVENMSLEDYVVGVLTAEMPASFEIEALKAQAVSARTYAFRKTLTPNAKHPHADVCDDHTCCQAYRSFVQASASWGEDSETYEAKLQRAVKETRGEILVYEGDPIDAVFHSSSAGRTQDAVQVWGKDVPYLRSVESIEGENVPNFESTVEVTKADFRSKMLETYPEAVLEGDMTSWIGDALYTNTGSVSQMDIGGVSLRGRDVRSIFSLRSTHFTVDVKSDCIVFHVTGYGHGVGMSQYGANAMAKRGDSYEDILMWYYSGVEILPYS